MNERMKKNQNSINKRKSKINETQTAKNSNSRHRRKTV